MAEKITKEDVEKMVKLIENELSFVYKRVYLHRNWLITSTLYWSKNWEEIGDALCEFPNKQSDLYDQLLVFLQGVRITKNKWK